MESLLDIGQRILISTVIYTAIYLFFNWIFKTDNTTIRENGFNYLYYGKRFKGFAIIFFIIICYALLASLNNPEQQSTGDYIGALSVFALFTSLLLEVLYVKIAYNGQYIYTQSPWRSNRKISRNSILGEEYNSWMSWTTVYTKDHGNIHIPDFINGRAEMLFDISRNYKKK